jgi:hypothetical protein
MSRSARKYQSLFDKLAPEHGRTFYIDFKPYRSYGKTLVKSAIRRWAKKNKVAVGVKITNPHLTGQQILVSVKQP